MIGAYNFDEKSPVISFKNGGFGFNYKNKKASENLLSNFAKCKRLTEKKRSFQFQIKKNNNYFIFAAM